MYMQHSQKRAKRIVRDSTQLTPCPATNTAHTTLTLIMTLLLNQSNNFSRPHCTLWTIWNAMWKWSVISLSNIIYFLVQCFYCFVQYFNVFVTSVSLLFL